MMWGRCGGMLSTTGSEPSVSARERLLPSLIQLPNGIVRSYCDDSSTISRLAA